jgi:hypothetical protein
MGEIAMTPPVWKRVFDATVTYTRRLYHATNLAKYQQS